MGTMGPVSQGDMDCPMKCCMADLLFRSPGEGWASREFYQLLIDRSKAGDMNVFPMAGPQAVSATILTPHEDEVNLDPPLEASGAVPRLSRGPVDLTMADAVDLVLVGAGRGLVPRITPRSMRGRGDRAPVGLGLWGDVPKPFSSRRMWHTR